MTHIFSTMSTSADLNKAFKEARGVERQAAATTKMSITVLANVSTQFLVKAIYTSLIFNGINPDIYESAFDQWEFELSNPDSEANRRQSDYTLLLLSSTQLINGNNRVKDPREFAANLRRLLTRYKEQGHRDIFMVLPEAIREGFDQTSIFYRAVKSFREELQSQLDGVVHFVDIDPLIMEFGFEKWHPTKFLMTAKLCCHPNCFPLYGSYLSIFLQSLLRRRTRLIVTDLDNTLWHGVVGEVGWEGVGLDHASEGYPHLMLQRYLLSLKEAGVLLAICSKNSFETVKAVFDSRKEMVLNFNDFVAQEISWAPKSEGIRRILRELNLTETGVMFLDDSKFEREEVKRSFPEVMVPELPGTPETWCEFLSRQGCLTVARVNEDDLTKSRTYLAEKQRKVDAEGHTDYSTFLTDLSLTIVPEKISESNFQRVLELIHKTNQFNLTTKRLSATQLKMLLSNNEYFCYCYSLQDKYGNYGIIAVFIAEKTTDDWRVHTWLMSCRAMGRGVEDSVFDHFLSTAVSSDGTVFAEYLPTEKNKPISDLLEKMGFNSHLQNHTKSFTVGKNTNPKAPHIRIAS